MIRVVYFPAAVLHERYRNFARSVPPIRYSIILIALFGRKIRYALINLALFPHGSLLLAMRSLEVLATDQLAHTDRNPYDKTYPQQRAP